MISYASMMSLTDDRFDDFDDEFEEDNMAKRRSGSSFGSFRGSFGTVLLHFTLSVAYGILPNTD